jgi:hypothetical protein
MTFRAGMTFRRPPVVASWLLTHLTNPDEGLVGDLTEEYQRRASRVWYWRQVAIAIGVGFVRGVWTHRLETLQAVLTGFAALPVLGRIVISPTLAFLSSVTGQTFSMPPGSWENSLMWFGAILWFIAALCTGRLIARLHPSQRATMVLANVLFLISWQIPELHRHITNAATHSRYTGYLFNHAASILMMATGILLGGLWGVHTQSEAASNDAEPPPSSNAQEVHEDQARAKSM